MAGYLLEDRQEDSPHYAAPHPLKTYNLQGIQVVGTKELLFNDIEARGKNGGDHEDDDTQRLGLNGFAAAAHENSDSNQDQAEEDKSDTGPVMFVELFLEEQNRHSSCEDDFHTPQHLVHARSHHSEGYVHHG